MVAAGSVERWGWLIEFPNKGEPKTRSVISFPFPRFYWGPNGGSYHLFKEIIPFPSECLSWHMLASLASKNYIICNIYMIIIHNTMLGGESPYFYCPLYNRILHIF